MKLRELLNGVPVASCAVDLEMEIAGVSYDSRATQPGDLFVAMTGYATDGHKYIATALEIYVNGSLNVFNHRSNIDMNNHRVLCFQLKSLGKALKEIGLLIMQDAVWNRVTANRSKHKTTWFYIDEFHLLLKGQTGSFSVEIWKRFRKWGGIPTGDWVCNLLAA